MALSFRTSVFIAIGLFSLVLVVGIVLLATAPACDDKTDKCQQQSSRRIAGIVLTVFGAVLVSVVAAIYYLHYLGGAKFVGYADGAVVMKDTVGTRIGRGVRKLRRGETKPKKIQVL